MRGQWDIYFISPQSFISHCLIPLDPCILQAFKFKVPLIKIIKILIFNAFEMIPISVKNLHYERGSVSGEFEFPFYAYTEHF